LAIEPGGTLLVTDSTNGIGTLTRVNPNTGSTQLLTQAGFLVSPWGVAVDGLGNIFIADDQTGPNQQGAIIRVNPLTGAQTILSQGDLFVDAIDVDFDQLGRLIVADTTGSSDGVSGALFRVDPFTGLQTRLCESDHYHLPLAVTVVPTVVPEPCSFT